METINKLDHELFLILNNLGNPSWDPLWLGITNKWYAIPIYVLLLYYLYKAYGLKQTLLALVLVAVLITCTDQLANVFKDAFQRLRPCRQEGIMEHARFVAPRCGSYGYFSAHAASTMALTFFIGNVLRNYYKALIFILFFWACLVGFSRIYLGVHYPGDVLTGMVLGGILGYLMYIVFNKLRNRFFNKSI